MKKASKLLVLVLVLALSLSVFIFTACGDTRTDMKLNEIGADAFINWINLASTRTVIQNYDGPSGEFGETLFTLLDSAEVYSGTVDSLKYAGSGASTNVVRISTTTSVKDTGLLGYLETLFEDATGWDLQVTSAGTGKAIQNAKDGLADLLLVHSKAQEEDFVNAGYARKVNGYNNIRLSFMYNYFVLVGPKTAPTSITEAASITDAFKAIKQNKFSFVSRGDNSGTHSKEVKLWELAGEIGFGYDSNLAVAKYPTEYSSWYTVTNSGMAASLITANEGSAYILSDKGTYLSSKNGATNLIPNLKVVYETDSNLKNTYSLIAVDSDGDGFQAK